MCQLMYCPQQNRGMRLWPEGHPGQQVFVLHSVHHLCRDIKPEHLYFDKDLQLKLGHFPQAVNLALYPIPPQNAALLDYTAPEVTMLHSGAAGTLYSMRPHWHCLAAQLQAPPQVGEGWPRWAPCEGNVISIPWSLTIATVPSSVKQMFADTGNPVT